MKVIRDEIQTSSLEYAKVLTKAHEDGFMVPHKDGYLWRVVDTYSHDFSRTEWVGPLANAPQGPINMPGPIVWMFVLERDA
jgi:hypothetical protein